MPPFTTTNNNGHLTQGRVPVLLPSEQIEEVDPRVTQYSKRLVALLNEGVGFGKDKTEGRAPPQKFINEVFVLLGLLHQLLGGEGVNNLVFGDDDGDMFRVFLACYGDARGSSDPKPLVRKHIQYVCAEMDMSVGQFNEYAKEKQLKGWKKADVFGLGKTNTVFVNKIVNELAENEPVQPQRLAATPIEPQSLENNFNDLSISSTAGAKKAASSSSSELVVYGGGATSTASSSSSALDPRAGRAPALSFSSSAADDDIDYDTGRGAAPAATNFAPPRSGENEDTAPQGTTFNNNGTVERFEVIQSQQVNHIQKQEVNHIQKQEVNHIQKQEIIQNQNITHTVQPAAFDEILEKLNAVNEKVDGVSEKVDGVSEKAGDNGEKLDGLAKPPTIKVPVAKSTGHRCGKCLQKLLNEDESKRGYCRDHLDATVFVFVPLPLA